MAWPAWALSILLAAAVSLTATIPLRRLAVRFGIMDHPGPRKVHRQPVAYLGGIAVLAGTLVPMMIFNPEFRRLPALLVLVAALGLFDDIVQASPQTKLAGEFAIALAAVMLGYSWHITDSAILNGAITMVWLVGLTNSFNLLDNMDGLSSTVAIGGLLTIAVCAPSVSPAALPLAGALAGFLVVNLPPARMYLGDSGSLMIGFGVGVATVLAANTTHGLHSLVLLVLPVALAVVDTALVIVSRLRTGRPVQLGGRDHASHRLLLLGFSKGQVLGVTVVALVAGGAVAWLATRYPLAQAWLAIPIAVPYLVAWGLLLRVDPYRVQDRSEPEVWSA